MSCLHTGFYFRVVRAMSYECSFRTSTCSWRQRRKIKSISEDFFLRHRTFLCFPKVSKHYRTLQNVSEYFRRNFATVEGDKMHFATGDEKYSFTFGVLLYVSESEAFFILRVLKPFCNILVFLYFHSTTGLKKLLPDCNNKC